VAEDKQKSAESEVGAERAPSAFSRLFGGWKKGREIDAMLEALQKNAGALSEGDWRRLGLAAVRRSNPFEEIWFAASAIAFDGATEERARRLKKALGALPWERGRNPNPQTEAAIETTLRHLLRIEEPCLAEALAQASQRELIGRGLTMLGGGRVAGSLDIWIAALEKVEGERAEAWKEETLGRLLGGTREPESHQESPSARAKRLRSASRFEQAWEKRKEAGDAGFRSALFELSAGGVDDLERLLRMATASGRAQSLRDARGGAELNLPEGWTLLMAAARLWTGLARDYLPWSDPFAVAPDGQTALSCACQSASEWAGNAEAREAAIATANMIMDATQSDPSFWNAAGPAPGSDNWTRGPSDGVSAWGVAASAGLVEVLGRLVEQGQENRAGCERRAPLAGLKTEAFFELSRLDPSLLPESTPESLWAALAAPWREKGWRPASPHTLWMLARMNFTERPERRFARMRRLAEWGMEDPNGPISRAGLGKPISLIGEALGGNLMPDSAAAIAALCDPCAVHEGRATISAAAGGRLNIEVWVSQKDGEAERWVRAETTKRSECRRLAAQAIGDAFAIQVGEGAAGALFCSAVESQQWMMAEGLVAHAPRAIDPELALALRRALDGGVKAEAPRLAAYAEALALRGAVAEASAQSGAPAGAAGSSEDAAGEGADNQKRASRPTRI
jgi:hypothetical protein